MAEQSVSLQPSESTSVAFEAIPHEAKTYQVSVNGLTGSFIAAPLYKAPHCIKLVSVSDESGDV